MICKTKERKLILDNKKYCRKEVRLSKNEYKFIVALSDGLATTYEVISQYMYGYYDEHSIVAIRLTKKRLLKKVKGLKIKTIKLIGYRLDEEILFE